MGLFDAIFGFNKPPKARLDPLFALSTAAITFETELGWVPAGRCGLVLHPATSQDYREAEEELQELLTLAVKETQTGMRTEIDEFRYRWLIFEDPDWDDLVELVHLAGQSLQEKGYDTQLLAAVFPFRRDPPSREQERDCLYLIFNYKRGRFYPFIPLGKRQERDSAGEMQCYALLEGELPWEKDVSRWYPLWGCPL